MTTPAQRRFDIASAKKAASEAAYGESMEGSNAYDLMMVKLYDDRRRLKEIQSVQGKIAVKHEVLPEYESWITGVLEEGNGAQDEVLVTVMVWYIDIGDYATALKIAEYVIKHDLVLPDQYERTVATVLVDEISDAALSEQKDEGSFPLNILQKLNELTEQQDMPDQARAKLHKALGHEYHINNDLDLALNFYESALKLNERVGVKRLIDEVKKLQAS